MLPRTTKDILDHADLLARRFKDYEPKPEDERDVGVYLALRQAVETRAEAERSIRSAVVDARRDGWSWRSIGALIGTSGEAARQRYGPAVST